MIVHDTELPGVRIVERERIEDDRGYFARTYSADDFGAAGMAPTVVECSVSYNHAAATLRGMHFQRPPFEEAKLVRCSRGRIWDVAVDVRLGSDTFGRWVGVELSDDNGCAVYLPEGFAHGFITLEPGCEVSYQISQRYHAPASAGVRWDDPTVAVDWPIEPRVMSERDRTLPTLAELAADLQEHL